MIKNILFQSIFSTVGVYTTNLYFGSLFEKKKQSGITDVIASVILFVLITGIERSSWGSERVLLTVFVYFLYEFLLYQGNLLKKIFYGIIYVLMNLLGMLTRGYISNVMMYQRQDNLGWSSEMDTIFIKIILLLVVLMIIHWDRKQTIKYDNRIFQMFLVFPLTTGVLIYAIFQSEIYKYGMQKKSGLLLVAIILLIVSNIVVQYMFEEYTFMQKKEKEREMEDMQKQMELGYYKKVEKSNQEYRKLLHDVKQYFSAINAMAKENHNHKILNFLQEIDCYLDGISNVAYSSNTMLNAILSEKKSVAMKKDIPFQVRMDKNVKIKGISDIDLIGIVGNMLDNAIEASDKIEKEEERSIMVEGYMSETHHFFVFSVKNAIKEAPEQKKGKFLTWKQDKDKHGIGLENIETILEKYGGYMNIEIKESTFCNTVFIGKFVL